MAVDVVGIPNPHIDLQETIGRGGFAVVYRAFDTKLNRPVAVKILTGLVDHDELRHFEQECRIHGPLSNHPGIVTVYDAGQTAAGSPYLVMEYLDGGTLTDRIARTGPVPWAEAAALLIPVCAAVQAAHDRGILHRDIKPSNILLGPDGPKLADFGIACGSETTSPLFAVSWLHAAPESQDNRRTRRSDVYSIGSTLFELLTGRAPFAAADQSVATLIRRITDEVPAPLPPSIAPARLARLVARCLAKDPSHRPASAAEVAAELTAIRSSRPGTGTMMAVAGGAPGEPVRATGSTPATGATSATGSTRAALADAAARPLPTPCLVPRTARNHDTAPTTAGITIGSGPTRPFTAASPPLVAALPAGRQAGTGRYRTGDSPILSPRADGPGPLYPTGHHPTGPHHPTGHVPIGSDHRPRRWPTVLTVVLLVATIVGLAIAYPTLFAPEGATGRADGRGQTSTPALSEQTSTTAQQITTSTGVVTTTSAAIVPASVAPVSTAPPVVSARIPEVIGLSEHDAIDLLSGKGFDTVTTRDEHSETVPAGSVVAVDPGVGTTTRFSATVELVISDGPVPPVAVPSVVGSLRDDAVAVLQGLGLVVEVATVVVDADSPDVGVVTAQDPGAGTELPPGSTVTLTVGRRSLTNPGEIISPQP